MKLTKEQKEEMKRRNAIKKKQMQRDEIIKKRYNEKVI